VGHHPGVGFVNAVASLQQIDPDLHILALRFANLTLGPFRQVRQVPVLDTDEIWLAKRKFEVKIDEPIEGHVDVGRLRDDRLRAGQQPGADADQQFDEQRLLVREVPVDGRAADARGGSDVLQPHREISTLGDEALGGRDQLRPAVGLEPAAAGLGTGDGGHFG
jgi:hypothetical protein